MNDREPTSEELAMIEKEQLIETEDDYWHATLSDREEDFFERKYGVSLMGLVNTPLDSRYLLENVL